MYAESSNEESKQSHNDLVLLNWLFVWGLFIIYSNAAAQANICIFGQLGAASSAIALAATNLNTAVEAGILIFINGFSALFTVHNVIPPIIRATIQINLSLLY
jgi:hypothetical protein